MNKPIITAKNVSGYVEEFLDSIFQEDVKITADKKFYTVNGSKFPIYRFWEKSDEELLKDFDNYLFDGDFIGTIFFFLSGYWEQMHPKHKDQYGRFPFEDSFVWKKDIIEFPVVDHLISELEKDLKLKRIEFLGKPKLFLTHDIDHLGLFKISDWWKTALVDLFKRGKPFVFFDKFLKFFFVKDPYLTENLIAFHSRHNTKGTYFFLPRVQQGITYGGYDVFANRKYLSRLSKKILDSNGSIGIHYDSLYMKEERMCKDKKILESIMGIKIASGRPHYLVMDGQKTFSILEKSQIKLDSSCYFAENFGFRYGTSFPFRPYNFEARRYYDVWEVPLVCMDGTMFSTKYMNLSTKQALERVKLMIDKIARYNGIFTFLLHNTSLYDKEWLKVYDEIVEYIKSKSFVPITSDDIVKQNI